VEGHLISLGSGDLLLTRALQTRPVRPVEPEPARARLERSVPGQDDGEVRRLREVDRRVRAHEQAHLGAAGQYAVAGPAFTYTKGPDGKLYAVGGEVRIDTSPVRGDPEATIRKMEQVRRAALAPGDPSSQDRTVAAAAARQETEAQAELLREPPAESDRGGQETRTRAIQVYGRSPAPRREPLVSTVA
jgi:SprA-related family